MQPVICPWCGHEMELEHYGIDEDESFAYECPDCAAVSPVSYSAESAFATAIARQLQKPLTVYEADNDEPCIFVERRDYQAIEAGWLYSSEKQFCILFLGENMASSYDIADYGKTIRCWNRKPTSEEREAARWVNEHE